MSRLFPICLAGLALSLVTMTSLGAAETDGDEPLPIATNRIRDEVTMHVRNAYLTFAETVVVSTIKPARDPGRPMKTHIVHLLFSPWWYKDGGEEGPAYPVLRPQLNLSAGQVVRFGLVNPEGEPIRKMDEITPECRYLLTVDFGHLLPEQLTVTVQMSSPVGLSPAAEMTYKPSNDGQPVRSGATAAQQTVVHIIADPNLEPWVVTRDGEVVPRHDAWVNLQRDVTHSFKFGEK